MSYKFIFDSSAIDLDSVSKMENAGLITACDSGKFNFYMTPPLLRECSHFITTGKVSHRAVKNIEFLVKIKWADFLNQLNGKDGILNMELTGLPDVDYLLVKNGEMIFKPQLIDVINGKVLPEETRKRLEEDDRLWRNAKEKLINDALHKRANLTNNIDIPSNIPPYEDIWEKFYPTIVSHYITGIAEKINPDIQPGDLVKSWEKQKGVCRWIDHFVKLHYFQQWYLITSKAEPKRDKNATDDMEHMIYLLYVDGIVSNEKHGFMRNAKQFFPIKDILSVDEFVECIKNG